MVTNPGTSSINRILYVDDEPGLLEIGKLFLEEDKTFTVDTTISALAALERLGSMQYDAIVSDYEMPKMNGIAFLKVLRDQGNTTPFIIFTGRGREDVVIEALNSGADFYLQKGGDPTAQYAELAHKIHHAISRRQAGWALKKSEQDYRQLIDHASEAIFVVQDERLRMANPQATELSGYSEQELLDQPFARFVHPDDGDLLLDRLRNRIVGSTTPTRHTFRIIRKDATIRWVELTVIGITWDERPAILNFMTDITERKIAEDAFRESEERYRNFFRTTLDGLFITTPDGRWIDFNEAVVDMFGFTTREEVFERPIISLYVHPEKRAVFVDLVEREGYVKEHPVLFRKRDDTVINTLMTVVPQKNPDGSTRVFIGTIRDITEHKLAEDALRESEERYRLFFKTSQDSVFISGPDRRYIDFNDKLFQKLGCATREEALAVDVASTYAHPEERDAFLEHVRRDGYVKEHPILFRKRDGTVIDCLISIVAQKNADDSIKAFFGTVRDITEQKRIDQALKESEERYRHIFESFEDLYYQTDNNGIITILSPSLFRLTGYKREELIGKPVTTMYVNPESRILLLEELVKSGHVKDYEVLLRKRDGTGIPVSLSANRLFHPDGTPAGVAGILRDITRRKQAEEELRRSEEKFRYLVEYALDGMLILDLQGNVLFANAAAARTVGLDNGTILIGRNVMEVIAPESLEEVLRDFAEVARGHDGFLAHYTLLSANGEKVPVESIGKAITYEGKTADLVFIRTGTGKK
ncbi:PAS domain S-box protein [Methanoregula sp.]|uniref:PAS domain S-box protein n=1 Tax=Methanoregula sp. TaxID=2052170 RepID=UPI00356A2FDF